MTWMTQAIDLRKTISDMQYQVYRHDVQYTVCSYTVQLYSIQLYSTQFSAVPHGGLTVTLHQFVELLVQ